MLTLQIYHREYQDRNHPFGKENFDGAAIIAQVVELDGLRKTTQTPLDNQAAEMNNLSKENRFFSNKATKLKLPQPKKKLS